MKKEKCLEYIEAIKKDQDKKGRQATAMQRQVHELLREANKATNSVREIRKQTNLLLTILINIMAADYDLRREYFEANFEIEKKRIELNRVVKIQSLTPEAFIKWIRKNEDGIVGVIKTALKNRPEK